MKRNTFKKLGFKLNKWVLALLIAGFAALNTGFTTQNDEIKAAEIEMADKVVEVAEVEAVDVLPDSVVAVNDEIKVEEKINSLDIDNAISAIEDVVARDIPMEEYNAAEDYVDLADYVEPEPVTPAYNSDPEYVAIMSMEATAYLPSDGGGYGITAMGIPARYGVVAVDPYVIPLGSRLYIPGYGEAIAADTGGAIYGYRIDLCMESYAEAMNFGRRNVTVYVLR